MSVVEWHQHILAGKQAERAGRLEDAVACYEACIRAGCDESYPYDRLVALYDMLRCLDDTIRVLRAAVVTYERTSQNRGDRTAKLTRYRAQLAKALLEHPVERQRLQREQADRQRQERYRRGQ